MRILSFRFLTPVFFILASNLGLACPLPEGTYNCSNASFSDLGKENVVIREIIFSNDGRNSISKWNATGDVWVENANGTGRFEKQDFQYVLNLTPGTHFVEDKTLTNSTCEVNPAGTQVFWGLFLRLPNQDDFYVSHMKITSVASTKKLLINKNDQNIFECQLKTIE